MPNLLLIREPGLLGAVATRSGCTIRPLPAEDVALIAEAYFASYVGSPDAFTRAEAESDAAATSRGEYGHYEAPYSAIAFEPAGSIREECIGAILVVRDPPYPDVPRGLFILDLFVTPAHRGRGLGRDLVLHTIAAAASDALSLRVDADNTPALALYRSLGFTAHARQALKNEGGGRSLESESG